MDLKFIIGAGFAAAGVVGAAIATAVSKSKKEDESPIMPNPNKVDMPSVEEADTAIQSSDELLCYSKMDEEIDEAWKEKELLEAEKKYYREQQIAEEIQQAWIEKEMLEDGYSIEEIENISRGYYTIEDNTEKNTEVFFEDDEDVAVGVFDSEIAVPKDRKEDESFNMPNQNEVEMQNYEEANTIIQSSGEVSNSSKMDEEIDEAWK